MIWTPFIKLLIWFLTALEFLLPSWNLPSEWWTVYDMFFTSMLQLNTVFPMKLIILSLSFIILFEIVILSTRIIGGAISLLRGGGGIDI